MPINLSIKNAPDHVVAALRERARRHHRSLQGEVLTILEDAVLPRKLTTNEFLEEVKKLGLKTPSDSVEIIRAMRDGR